MEVRKHIPKNNAGQISLPDYDKIKDRAEELVTGFLKEFPEWDIDDLFVILDRSGKWAATMLMLTEEEELIKGGINPRDIRKE